MLHFDCVILIQFCPLSFAKKVFFCEILSRTFSFFLSKHYDFKGSIGNSRIFRNLSKILGFVARYLLIVNYRGRQQAFFIFLERKEGGS